MCPADPASDGLLKDPYEKFMYQHLQYYGYFRDQIKTPPESREDSSHHVLKPGSFNERGKTKHNSDKNLLCSVMPEAALKSKQLLLDHPEGPCVLRLREPRNLSSLPSGKDSVLAPLWPIECEVVEDAIHHIEWVPPEPEPFYQPTGNEYAPDVVGEDYGTVVYSINPATKGTYFTGSRVGGSRESIKPAAHCLRDPEDTMLLFESRFESGNLQKAVRVGKYEYELTLRTDLYTSKHTQWYYFRVQNTRKDVTYRFTIVNLMKAKSLYNMGMKPLLYSQKDARSHSVGWRREGSDIKYYKYNTEDGQTLYCLTWTVSFPHSHDTCYFAHFYPYTYSDLQRYLLTLINNPVCSQYCKLRPLCNSLAGNIVYLLTITNPSKSAVAAAAKKAIVLSARVHPGETNSSWVMRGFLDFILSDAPDAQLLRDLFIFKVVPMLNPDGVIVGNYRCSLAGRDLNRNYRTLLKESFPCIWHTRAMIKRVLEEREILLYCDFHGHSRKNNIFMYGCNNKNTQEQLLHERIFPLMLSKNIPDKFSFNSCKFQVQKCKEGTGRVVMWRMGILNSYTMESTFSGSTLGSKSNSHFTSEDLKTLGYHVCDTLLDFCDPDRSKFQQCLSEVKEIMKQKIQRKLSELGHEQNTEGTWSDVSLSDVESSTSGSDSSQSDGPPAHLINMVEKDYNEKKKKKKKKRLRTRKERNNLHHNHSVRHTVNHKEDVVASTISPSNGKCRSLSKISQRDSSSEQKNKQMNRVIYMCQAKDIEDSSFLQRENLNNCQKSQEVPLDKQTVPVFEYEMRIKEPKPTLVMISPSQRQTLKMSLVKQHPPPFHEQPSGELLGKMNPGLTIPSSSGLKRHRSMWWNPEVPSVTSMLRRSLSLKSQYALDNNRLWHLSQSRSQILAHRDFKWKPFQIDRMLLKTESECHAKYRTPPGKIEQKHSSLEC
ncbi:cytosolic carboxypeptidase 2 isoform X2 [Sceloporus undulatus]|uniref:cytosolic carboxypeptidase 2 isoform X2 n=1 Tax=Sceloporus undulatus TaxID=8520 RepID=UPI001C4AEEDD|nr:cytosolic carboxypeptidase 2 isoform X2 [Sceloporus undulatus]XP_042301971.1 cytosolic carboxypeptidase 2 isoform X2 [Sceloporus undulatus]XP_042301972.1 cytosolic carboxypeptidase 2 isoform X2 [Sceloporus undulatus]